MSFFPMYVVIAVVARSISQDVPDPGDHDVAVASLSLAGFTWLRLKWIENAIGLKGVCTLNRSFLQEFVLSAARFVLMTSLLWATYGSLLDDVLRLTAGRIEFDNWAYGFAQTSAKAYVARSVGYGIETVIRRHMLTGEGFLASTKALVKNHGVMCLWDGFLVDLMADIIHWTLI
eukprot:UN04483